MLWLESSDYVARFRDLYNRQVDPGIIVMPSPPERLVSRLAKLSLTWEVLPQLLRQAVLWDMGFVVGKVSGIDSYLQVYTKCGETMAYIGLTMSEFIAVNNKSHTATTCFSVVDGVNKTILRQELAYGPLVDQVVKCAIDSADLPDPQASMLSQDALGANVVPQPRVWRHHDPSQGWTKPAIHTLPISNYPEAGWSKCPTNPSARTIPCEEHNASPGSINTCLPKSSSVMDNWLLAFKAELPATEISRTSTPVASTTSPPENTNTVVIICCIAAAIVVILLIVLFCLWYRRRKRKESELNTYEETPQRCGSTEPSRGYYGSSLTPAHHTVLATLDVGMFSMAINSLYEAPCLQTKKLNFKDVEVEYSIAAGAYGEIFLGIYKNKQVAIKRIQKHRLVIKGAFEAFCEEIKLMGHLDHPSIVYFYGYFWDLKSPDSLSAVTEYLPHGDLKMYLTSNPDMSWTTKIVFAVDIAKALQYLHERVKPMIIHRDLKSKNILVDLPHAKLSDFGISREQINDGTLTVGVGTVYYSAPEVMSGSKYSKQADMYSFGCVLTELDTQRSLYSHLNVQPVAVLNMIISEGLRPTVSDFCPKVIEDLIQRCFNADPTLRPTASQAVQELELLASKIKRTN